MASGRNIFKSIIHGLFVLLLSTATFAGIALISVALTITDRETIKSWPVEAGVYEEITPNILDLAAHSRSEEGNDGGDELNRLLNSETLDTNRLKSAIASVYNSRYWQTKYDTVIDSTYNWLEGSQPELMFELNFGDRMDELAGSVSTEVANQLAGLSTCSSNQLPSQFDILSAKCLPPGVSATQAANQLERSLKDGLGRQELLLSSDNIDMSPEQEQNLQRIYQAASQIPLIFAAVSLVLIGLVAVTGRSWLHGLRRAGLVLISAGILSWIGFFLLKQVGNIRPPVNDEATKEMVENVAAPLVQTMIVSFSNIGLWVALTVVIAGILLWMAAYMWHKVHHHSEAEKIAKRAMAGRDAADNPTLPKPIDPNSK